MYVCMHVCMYVCVYVCPNEGLIGTLCACCETSKTILALEVCECPKIVTEKSGKLSQNSGMDRGGSVSVCTCVCE